MKNQSSLIVPTRANAKVNRLWFKNRVKAGVFMKKCTGVYTDDYAYDAHVNFQKESEFSPCPEDFFTDYELSYMSIYSDETGSNFKVSFAGYNYDFRFKTILELGMEPAAEPAPVVPETQQEIVEPIHTFVSEDQSHEIIFKQNPNYSLKNKVIGGSDDAARVLKCLYNDNTSQLYEQFVVLFLSQKHQVEGHYIVGSGGITATIVDLRVIFTNALKLGRVTRIVLSHNHPSGNMRPSESDRSLTKRIKEAGKILEIEVLDHIIMDGTNLDNYYSFADNGDI